MSAAIFYVQTMMDRGALWFKRISNSKLKIFGLRNVLLQGT
jgi:hypothetical protein